MRKPTVKSMNRCRFKCAECKPIDQDTSWFRTNATSVKPPANIQALYRERDSGILVVAPHGGKIEPGTEEIAGMVAHELGCSCYCFCSGHRKGERKDPGGEDGHHIASTEIGAPNLPKLVAACDFAVSIHGTNNHSIIQVGGHNRRLAKDIADALYKNNCPAEVAVDPHMGGQSLDNFVNQCSKEGVQLEIPLRPYRLPDAGGERRRLAEAVASVLRDELQALNQQGSP